MAPTAAPAIPPATGVVGILNLDKPAGITSQAALTRLKRSSGQRRLGHAGTLDPLATGVLPVFFGRATVLVDRLLRAGKTYEATIRLGAGSDTDDAAGTLLLAEVPAGLGREAVERALASFVGVIRQRPPAYSAIKVEGERSYRLARKGEEPELVEREVEVRSIELLDFGAGADGAEPGADGVQTAPVAGPLLRLRVDCGSGFYVRALARDLGAALGTAGYLASLRRTRVGGLHLENAIGLDDAIAAADGLADRLLPAASVLQDLQRVEVGPAGTVPLRHGREVPAPGIENGEAWAGDAAGRVLALGRVSAGMFLPKRLVELS